MKRLYMTPLEVATLPLGLLAFGLVVLVSGLEKVGVLPLECLRRESANSNDQQEGRSNG